MLFQILVNAITNEETQQTEKDRSIFIMKTYLKSIKLI